MEWQKDKQAEQIDGKTGKEKHKWKTEINRQIDRWTEGKTVRWTDKWTNWQRDRDMTNFFSLLSYLKVSANYHLKFFQQKFITWSWKWMWCEEKLANPYEKSTGAWGQDHPQVLRTGPPPSIHPDSVLLFILIILLWLISDLIYTFSPKKTPNTNLLLKSCSSLIIYTGNTTRLLTLCANEYLLNYNYYMLLHQ